MADRVDPVAPAPHLIISAQQHRGVDGEFSPAHGSAEQRGGKAIGLDLLSKHQELGYTVPPYEVLDTSWHETLQRQLLMARSLTQLSGEPYAAHGLPPELQARVNTLVERFSGMDVIVRSNSLLEDMQISFAGRYDSVVVRNLTSESLTTAILQVYASLDNPRARVFREEHGIVEDRMGIVVQEYIDADFSGVMFTSNPSYPGDLTVEIGRGPGAIVNAEKAVISVFDYDKKTGMPVYERDDIGLLSLEEEGLKLLVRAGIELEQRTGPGELEFCIKGKSIYLIQRKHIRDLSLPDPDLELPPNKQRKFLATSHCVRGQGLFILPVVKVQDPQMVAYENPAIDLLPPSLADAARIDLARTTLPGWFAALGKADKDFADGYVLVTPHFHETQFPIWASLTNRGCETNFHSLTPHKRAVVTSEQASMGSHIMDLARADKVAYAGLLNSPNIFQQLETGDVIAVHFRGREADIYLEDTSARRTRLIFGSIPPENIQIQRGDDGHPEIKLNLPQCEPQVVFDGLGHFLEKLTGEKWNFHKSPGAMGGAFVNSRSTGIGVGGYAYSGISQHYYFHNLKLFFVEPVPRRISASRLAMIEESLVAELKAQGVS